MIDEYYLGLDVGTNSVGYAVTDKNYKLLKFKGEPMWGAHVFEEGQNCDQRRGFRTARRRLARRRQRINLVQEIFAPEIGKIDERFFIRLKESMLWRDDVPTMDRHILFCDEKFTDKDYFHKYPTIHHLLCELMESSAPHDVRMVYLAVAWLVGHRGHFLNEIDKDNISEVTDFVAIYADVCHYMEQNELLPVWGSDKSTALQEILPKRQKMSKAEMEKEILKILYDGSKPNDTEDDTVSLSLSVKLLAGGTVKACKLFPQGEYDESISLCFADAEDKFEEAVGQIGDEVDWVRSLRRLYDWSLLKDVLRGEQTVSAGKVKVYEQHRRDLRALKSFVRKYAPSKYANIFRSGGEKEKNYVAYSYNVNSLDDDLPGKKATAIEFCDYLKKELKGIVCQPEDESFYQDMMKRLDLHTFMPKQVNGENRVIPYQLYYHELKLILDKASGYLPFLQVKDADGVSNVEKLLSIMSFRIPYFVGPLNANSPYAWVIRKGKKKIRPWNFNEQVDIEKSEEAFIRRMTNKCTYLPGEDVLPFNSLLYQKFMVLNEINTIKVNGVPITTGAKQQIYRLFEKRRKVTKKAIRDCLLENIFIVTDKEHKKDDIIISGVDDNLHSSLKSYHDFCDLLFKRKILNYEQVEEIIERLTYSDDKRRIRDWLSNKYPELDDADRKYIAKLKYNDFGRLSRKFLTGIRGISKETGECASIMHFLWETNDNLMQLLSDLKYTFFDVALKAKHDYLVEDNKSIESIMDDMRIANAVRRPIYRTLDIVRDVCKATGRAPKKIFLEMARGGGEKGKRTVSRREHLERLYKDIEKEYGEDVRALSAKLNGVSDNRLQSEALYLYFLQLGRSMYSGTPIDIENLKNDSLYNVDHIYPQAYVKDNSLDNKVLVTSNENGAKGDSYPIRDEIRNKMAGLWTRYKKMGLISEKKYNRLMRCTPFTDDEKMGFIQRQLVETRQSTKALATIFKMRYPNTEIVYVKAGLVSDFRHEFGMLKCRVINDLHHAKDAYLNIVVGNVYDSKFNSIWFKLNEKYSVKTKNLFTHDVLLGKEKIWQGENDIGYVREVMKKNNIHYTCYAFEKKGELFDGNLIKKRTLLISRKKDWNTEKYGGYNKPTISFYILVRYVLKSKKDEVGLMLVPVMLLSKACVEKEAESTKNYLRNIISDITDKDVNLIDEVALPLGLRHIKVNTLFEVDGFRWCLASKTNDRLKVKGMVPLIMSTEKEKYIKKLESFHNKQQKNKELKVDGIFDGINKEANCLIYEFLQGKACSKPYCKMEQIAKLKKVLDDGKEKFMSLPLHEQVISLLNILDVFKSWRNAPCNLSLIGGKGKSAVMTVPLRLSAWKACDVRMVEQSAGGLFTSKSQNLLEFL